MTMPPPSAERQQVVIPAQGMIDIRDALTDILSEFGVSYNFGEMLQLVCMIALQNMTKLTTKFVHWLYFAILCFQFIRCV